LIDHLVGGDGQIQPQSKQLGFAAGHDAEILGTGHRAVATGARIGTPRNGRTIERGAPDPPAQSGPRCGSPLGESAR
jgi:hypothetical protein